MAPGTAAHKLRQDLLWGFVKAAGHACYHCGGELTRETFSIEHKRPWLDSDDPTGLFFDVENIAYSHFTCNSGAARRNPTNKSPIPLKERRRIARALTYSPQERRAKYLRNGT